MQAVAVVVATQPELKVGQLAPAEGEEEQPKHGQLPPALRRAAAASHAQRPEARPFRDLDEDLAAHDADERAMPTLSQTEELGVRPVRRRVRAQVLGPHTVPEWPQPVRHQVVQLSLQAPIERLTFLLHPCRLALAGPRRTRVVAGRGWPPRGRCWNVLSRLGARRQRISLQCCSHPTSL
eukprot:scaffold21924_cov62-Phaeocystis_antarctica.AAC.7